MVQIYPYAETHRHVSDLDLPEKHHKSPPLAVTNLDLEFIFLTS